MYISGFFKEADLDKVKNFMRQNDFVTLVCWDGEVPVASHVLVSLEDENGKLFVYGHVARANSLWRNFENGKDVLLIFSGPDAYISARWYDHVNVPTWNYIAVHAYGKPSLIHDDVELHGILARLVASHEPGTGYSLDGLPSEFVNKQMQAVIGFKVELTRLEASFKLSQNRNDDDYANVISELEKRTDQNSRQVASAMREQRATKPK
ncbi:MAG: FMN-binding negative transcriptional regulator [Chloroflexi bacterium]|nr:FMN-binding negative transcriptional regulator [Chloroflexota bacterium]